MGHYRSFCIHMNPLRSLFVSACPYVFFHVLVGFYMSLLVFMGCDGSFKELMRPYRALWVVIWLYVCYASVKVIMGPYKPSCINQSL